MLQHNWRVTSPANQSKFWDRLEEASEDVGLPCGLSDIGRELDIWPSAVQKWKDGINYPAKKNLITLAKNRGINLEWLETGRGPKKAEGAMDAATRELLSIWNKLPQDAQNRILTAVRYEQLTTPIPRDHSPGETERPSDSPHHSPKRRK